MNACIQCQQNFTVTDTDRQFYAKISPVLNGQKFAIPEPTLCPQCRMQRRMMWRGELNLFKRKSAFSGKDILTFYPPESNVKVYAHDEWWSDKWNPLSYGRDFDFNRPFFDQFKELVESVPLLCLSAQQNSENSDYCNCASWNKNCYLLAGANYNEDCYYGNYVNHAKNCVDNNFIAKCELCYECIDCTGCYNLKYSFNSHNCSDSWFLHNCRNCHHCFGSVNLVNKEYVFMNQQLTKDDYEKKLAGLQLDRRSRIREAQQFFQSHRLKYPQKFMIGDLNENVSGNAINQCRNSFDCFDVSELEDCRYCSWFHRSKNCMDIYAWGFTAELCYECMEAGDSSYHVLFSVSSYGSQNTMYSYYPMYSKDLFGCVSMNRKQYCILNKQYSPAEYEKLVPKIIQHMQRTGEWGQFFPMSVSPLAYNTSIAGDYFPLSKEEALRRNCLWHNEKAEYKVSGAPYQVPDSIHEVDEAILSRVLVCAKTGKPYKLIPQELNFYQKNNIPVPDRCFTVRHKERLLQRNPRRLWDRKCQKCQTAITTSYAPDLPARSASAEAGRPEVVYCEGCYLKEVY